MTIRNILLAKNTFILITVLSGLLLVSPIVSSVAVGAQGRTEVCEGLGGCEPQGASDLRVAGVIVGALNILSILVGVAAVFMIMLGGFRYITAGGDASKVASAQNTIIWAIVGLVVTAMAQVIVRFVLDRI